MKRRSYLSMIALPAMAGCSSQSPSATDTGVTITDSSLLSHWEEFGDVVSNQMNAVGAGGFARIGTRYEIPVHDGKTEELFQVTIYNDESSIDSKSSEDTRLVSEDIQRDQYERQVAFDTSDWEQGNYTAEIIVRDEVTEQNTTEEFEFSVTDPLGSNEVELIEVVQPPEWEVGQSDTFSIRIRNNSGRDGSIVSPMSVRIDDSQWVTYSEKYRINLPAGKTRVDNSVEETFDRAGTFEFRIDDIGESWTIDVSE